MNTIRKIATVLAMAALAVAVSAPRPVAAGALANLTNTTTSAAMDASQKTIKLASNTGVVAASGSIVNTLLIADDEVLAVYGEVGSTTTWNVTRGYRGTLAQPHNSGGVVIVVANGNPQQVFDSFLRGACTAANIPYSPRIVLSAGMRGTKQVYYESCTGPTSAQIWREATPLGDTTTGDTTVADIPGIGQVAYSSLGTTTAGVSGTEYVSSIFVPQTQVFTGVKILQNGTVGTDKMIGTLRDAAGNLLATSSLSGVATASANTFLALPFTATIILPGPARYYIGAQMGTSATDGMFLQATGQNVNTLTSSATGTFGTIPTTFTVPTTFTTAKGPIGFLY